jgi:hypothetical protein
MAILNRLLGEPYVCQDFLNLLLDSSNQNFYNTFKESNLEAEFYYLKNRIAKSLNRINAHDIAYCLIRDDFFILENDDFINNQIVRDSEFHHFINKNIDIFIYTYLSKLLGESISDSVAKGLEPIGDLSSYNNQLWDKYNMKNPTSTLHKTFKQDPKLEHLLNQNKMNKLVFLYAGLD